jgi:hypothetical protein
MDEKLVDFTESFFNDCVYVQEMNQPIGQMTYFAMEVEKAVDTDSFDTISLVPMQQLISTENFSYSTLTKKLEEVKLNELGIDVSSQKKRVLMNEVKVDFVKKCINKFIELGTINRESNLTKKQLFFRKFFKNMKFPIYIEEETFDDESSLRKIISKILLYSNLIASKGRRGPGNFIIMNPALGSVLQDNPSFVFNTDSLSGINAGSSPAIPYCVGRLSGLKVYVNPFKRFDDFSFIIGRRGMNTDPGVYLCNHTDSFNEYDVNEEESKSVLTKRAAVVTIGDDVQNLFYVNEFVFGKKPWWRKLFNL